MSSSLPPVRLYPDGGVRVISFAIMCCLPVGLLASPLLILAVINLISGKDATDLIGLSLIGIVLLAASIGLIFFRKAKIRAREEQEPAVEFSELGIKTSSQGAWRWETIEDLVPQIEAAGRNAYIRAFLYIQFKDLSSVSIDLKPLTGKHESTVETAREMLRRSKGIDVSSLRDSEAPIPCPCCSTPSDSIKQIESISVFFYLLGINANTKHIVGCPDRLRSQLQADALKNLLTSHVMWPIILEYGLRSRSAR
ncbi:MAG: hypothetical protein AAF394_02725 [Planctomycetota bacterium]